jgi:hypothetical protein
VAWGREIPLLLRRRRRRAATCSRVDLFGALWVGCLRRVGGRGGFYRGGGFSTRP